MSGPACVRLSSDELLGYWLGEPGELAESTVEEHLFECAACAERLEAIIRLRAAVRRELARGALTFVTSPSFLADVKQAGWRVREYRVDAGRSVDCTVTSDDDLVVAYLRAPLRGVRRLDLSVDDSTAGSHRFEDVPFDSEGGTVAAVMSTVHLRSLARTRQIVRLLAVDETEERLLGEYTFNHSPS